MTIQISEKAKNRLRDLGVGGDSFLRLAVTAGGCSGNTYTAAVDDAVRDGDQVVYEQGGLRAVADLNSVLHLDGLEIDYSDDLIQSGFRFKNPNAAKSCGCGASFQT